MGDTKDKEEEMYSKAKSYTNTLIMNGKTYLKNVKSLPRKQIIKTVDVVVGDDHLLEVELSGGNWILNALVIKRK